MIWRRQRPKKPVLEQFLQTYQQQLQGRNSICSKCNALFDVNNCWVYRNGVYPSYYGQQNNTCYNCLGYFCDDCRDEDGMSYKHYFSCNMCRRDYCLDCCQSGKCSLCDDEYCAQCDPVEECQDCGNDFCTDCSPRAECSCWDALYCNKCAPIYNMCQFEGCTNFYCGLCSESNSLTVARCDDCEAEYCSDCRYLQCSKDEWSSACDGCLKLVAPMLVKENNKLQQEIKELRKENRQLLLDSQPAESCIMRDYL